MKVQFSESGFRIPENGISGVWKINISSGSNLEIIEFECIYNQ